MATNRFDFLRLFFASGVFAFHIVVLAQLTPNGVLEGWLSHLAELSIHGFFIISGALIYGSYVRSKTVGSYAEKRIRRLMPAYAVVILIPALTALFMSGNLADVARYFFANIVFLNFLDPDLSGFFDNNWISAVNGALWTLKIEVMFYLILPILAWLLAVAGRLKWVLLGVIYIAAEIWRQRLSAGAMPLPADLVSYTEQLSRQLPGQMSFFVTGMVLWMLWDKAKTAPIWLLPAGLVIFLMSAFVPALEGLRAIGLGCLVAYIAFATGPKLNAARWGDMSYGVYITHFPIIQMLIALGVFAASPILGIMAAIVLVFGASFALWHLIEKPSLLPTSHYRQKAVKP